MIKGGRGISRFLTFADQGVTKGYYKWPQIEQFTASYSLTIYQGCSFEEYLVKLSQGAMKSWQCSCSVKLSNCKTVKRMLFWLTLSYTIYKYSPDNVYLIYVLRCNNSSRGDRILNIIILNIIRKLFFLKTQF